MDSLETLRQNRRLLEGLGVADLWVFGSLARGEPSPGDADILVEFKSPPGLLEYMGLKFKMEELLGMPVDIVSKAACKERFLRRIEPELLHVA